MTTSDLEAAKPTNGNDNGNGGRDRYYEPVARLDLQLRMAGLKLTLLGTPENLRTVVDHLQRQLDPVNEEMANHDQKLSALEPARKPKMELPISLKPIARIP